MKISLPGVASNLSCVVADFLGDPAEYEDDVLNYVRGAVIALL